MGFGSPNLRPSNLANTINSNYSCYKQPAYRLGPKFAGMARQSSLSKETRISNSELNRILNRHNVNSQKFMMLDTKHLKKLQDPANMRKREYY